MFLVQFKCNILSGGGFVCAQMIHYVWINVLHYLTRDRGQIYRPVQLAGSVRAPILKIGVMFAQSQYYGTTPVLVHVGK